MVSPCKLAWKHRKGSDSQVESCPAKSQKLFLGLGLPAYNVQKAQLRNQNASQANIPI